MLIDSNQFSKQKYLLTWDWELSLCNTMVDSVSCTCSAYHRAHLNLPSLQTYSHSLGLVLFTNGKSRPADSCSLSISPCTPFGQPRHNVHIIRYALDCGVLYSGSNSAMPSYLKGGIRSLFDTYVNAMGWRPFWWSSMEVSYCTSGFGAIILSNLRTLSLPHV